jgi:hypothetical protein
MHSTRVAAGTFPSWESRRGSAARAPLAIVLVVSARVNRLDCNSRKKWDIKMEKKIKKVVP